MKKENKVNNRLVEMENRNIPFRNVAPILFTQEEFELLMRLQKIDFVENIIINFPIYDYIDIKLDYSITEEISNKIVEYLKKSEYIQFLPSDYLISIVIEENRNKYADYINKLNDFCKFLKKMEINWFEYLDSNY